MNEFTDVPKDEETTIYHESNSTFKNLTVKRESWYYEGILGNSLIFLKEEIKDLPFDEFLNDVKVYLETDKITVSDKNEKFLFINYGFKSLDDD